jgi:hypothetical protein
MLGFHRRTRSLIPVKELVKYDVVSLDEEEMYGYESDEEEEMEKETDASDGRASDKRRMLVLVYLIFFAEA